MEMQHFDEIYEWYRCRDEFSPRRKKFEQRIRTVYPILEDIARQQEVITYGNLAEEANTDPRRYLTLVLGAITRMEYQEGHPALSVLVVQSGRRIPSHGFFKLVRELSIDSRYNSSSDKELFEDIKEGVYRFWASK